MPSIEEQIIDLISKRMPARTVPVTLDSKLNELGLESLDVVEITFDLEELFNIEIPYNANKGAGPEFNTVGDVVTAVRRSLPVDWPAP